MPVNHFTVTLSTSKPSLTLDNTETELLVKPEIQVSGKTDASNQVTFKSGSFTEALTGDDANGKFSFDFDLNTSSP